MIALRRIATFIGLLITLQYLIILPQAVYAQETQNKASTIIIDQWEMRWEEQVELESSYNRQTLLSNEQDWLRINYEQLAPVKPAAIHSAWVRVQLPTLEWDNPGLLINKAYAQNVYIYIDDRKIFESARGYGYDVNTIIIPLSPSDSNKTIFMRLTSDSDRIGIQEKLIVGNYQELLQDYMKRDIIDMILGASLMIISIIMIFCTMFIQRSYLTGWNSVSVVILSVGVMITTYSPFLYTFYTKYASVYYRLFDFALMAVMPAIFLFFEKIFGEGPFALLKRFRKFQIIVSFVSLFLLVINLVSNNSIRDLYFFFSVTISGIVTIISSIILVYSLVYYCVKRNKEAVIVTIGFSLFALVVSLEIVWFMLKETHYELYYWKWGMLCFIFSLIIILARRIAQNYEQIVDYSKKLEIYNNELQRSEKMDIISQLAASVAHEVRNPLQVTRGFLQLLGEKATNEKDRIYLALSIEELDRASNIITDFLTFAKPQMEQITVLNVADELRQIEGILIPLANLQGGEMKVDLPNNLLVRGNSSKFKQAFINMIKNSVEALNGQGLIEIWAYKHNEQVVIHIKDDGEGMTENELKKLGEPYFSNKSKGTGLGLMVTFRIIEVMGGELEFKSVKGMGTEAIIRFPIV